jgi:hypothetical protein
MKHFGEKYISVSFEENHISGSMFKTVVLIISLYAEQLRFFLINLVHKINWF